MAEIDLTEEDLRTIIHLLPGGELRKRLQRRLDEMTKPVKGYQVAWPGSRGLWYLCQECEADPLYAITVRHQIILMEDPIKFVCDECDGDF